MSNFLYKFSNNSIKNSLKGLITSKGGILQIMALEEDYPMP